MTPHQWAEVAHWMSLVPLGWLLVLRWRGHERNARFWWTAGALGISWLADSSAHVASPWIGSIVYPVSQAALIGATLLDRDDAKTFLVVLVCAGVVSVGLNGARGPDVLLSTIACLGVAGIAYTYRAVGRAWIALLIYFGVGQLAWLALSLWIAHCAGELACLKQPEGMALGYLYQAIRAVGLGVFCYAATYPAPRFSLSRTIRAHERSVRSFQLR